MTLKQVYLEETMDEEERRTDTGSMFPSTQIQVPVCGSLFNCHCENKVQDPTNNLECTRWMFYST